MARNQAILAVYERKALHCKGKGCIDMRLDNTDETVIEYYDLDFDPNNPGMTNPVDLCEWCANNWPIELFIDAPKYDKTYRCFECGDKLL